MTQESSSRGIEKRLSIVISLLLELASGEPEMDTTAKVQKLFDLGLSAAEIGEIIGRPTNYVTAVTHRIKSAKSKE